MLPNYLGHVPGETFRFGKTFGADTKDAKRWLRGDFSTAYSSKIEYNLK